MNFLNNVLSGIPEFRQLYEAVSKERFPAMATGLSSVHKAHLIHHLCFHSGRRALVIAGDEAEASKLCADITSMGTKAVFYPARDFTFRNVEGASREFEHQRIGALWSFMSGESRVLVCCADAAVQYTIPKNTLKASTAVIKEGTRISPEELVSLLVSGGYVRTEQIDGTGQFALRGGILDFFMPSSSQPCRIEFWGDEIDTVSAFDIETQRRTERLSSFVITPSSEIIFGDAGALADKIDEKARSLRGKAAPLAREILKKEADLLRSGGRLSSADKFYSLVYDKPADIFDYTDDQDFVFVSEQNKTDDKLKSTLWQWGEDAKDYLAEGVLCKGLDTFSGGKVELLRSIEKSRLIFCENYTRGTCELPLKTLVNFSVRQLSPWSGSISVLCEDLEILAAKGRTCVILAGTKKAAENLCKDLCGREFPAAMLSPESELPGAGLYVSYGSLSSGIEYFQTGFSLITHVQIAEASKPKSRKRSKGKAIFSLAELSIGDYVVHTVHGIGKFGGIKKIELDGITKDYISIQYAKGDTLYIPVTQMDQVSKYIGPHEDSTVKLNRLGGQEWQKAKSRVRSAVKDIADGLVKLYSERMKAKGHAFPPDGEWQRDFEARFEYEETADQKRCIEEIKNDMEKVSPMDRLLCGDVGFGKTEVALRAAFKCVTDSKQCALLVPTTILAWQHYQTVLRRFEGFPVSVELLSRFRSPSQQAEIIRKLKRGDIDMVIGTHRLISKDISFRDLGLVIIDEEQRFGVAQKERLKDMCRDVDVLTLSATPIPRTLNMAMSGIRDMSSIEEAPQDRHPVQTYVLEYDEAIINEAIRRELRRGGQVFYLYNSVEDIEQKAQGIADRIPEAKVAYGHGKMNEGQLSEVWRKMLEQEINVLVSTTIIETGVDIPNANTLIIENADRMGLSQLHQIRGRVGRSSRRAYAYLTFRRDKVLSEISQKRLDAIREFTEFGSGFKIAMRDLELRGAGNLLGAQQHGHMADVGYDMYMKLLGEAVREAKGEEPAEEDADCLIDIRTDAHIPEEYIGSNQHRLEIYRRIADIRTKDDAEDVTDELIDRFGDVPAPVERLINIALLRSKARKLGITEVAQRNDHLLLYVTKLKSESTADIVSRFNGRAMLSAGAKPYIAVRIKPGENTQELVNQILQV